MTIREEIGTIAIVDDDADIRAALRQMLQIENFRAVDFADGGNALAVIDGAFPGIVMTDLRMPGMDGSVLFERLHAIDPELPVIMMSGHGDIATAVDLVKRGAYDFQSKPFDNDALIATVRRALEKRSLVMENRQLRAQPVSREREAIVGDSPVIEAFRQTLGQLAQADIDVLITGESGSGKSLAADTLHRRSPRGRKTMIAVDCGALPTEDAESLLFGHVSGAFIGAQFPRTGQLLRADGSTLFLDHVDSLTLGLQTRILHTLENRSVQPIGVNQSQTSNFRTISASSGNVDSLVSAGRFDRSLYFRLSQYRLDMPPLRARKGDVIVLFRSFLAAASADLGHDTPSLSPAVWRKLQDHDWPGNVRELRSFAANVALGLGDPAAATVTGQQRGSDMGLKAAIAVFEADLIRSALDRCRGDIAATTAALRLPRKTFYDKIARHSINPNDYRPRRSRTE